MTVLNEADRIYIGTQAANAVHAGVEKVWPLWTPADFIGLTIWFDASQLEGADGSALSVWPNLGSGGPGTILWAPPTISPNKLNGQRLVRFSQNGGILRMTGTGINHDFTLVCVAHMVPGGFSGGRIINASYPPANFLLGWWNGFEDAAYSSTGGFFLPDTKKAVTSNWYMYSADAQSDINFRPRLFRDGVLLCTGGQEGVGVGASDGWNGTFNINGYSATGYEETCDFEVAEVVLYNRKLSDADRQTVEGYLRDKWLS
jgi:hypothetical protein